MDAKNKQTHFFRKFSTLFKRLRRVSLAQVDNICDDSLTMQLRARRRALLPRKERKPRKWEPLPRYEIHMGLKTSPEETHPENG